MKVCYTVSVILQCHYRLNIVSNVCKYDCVTLKALLNVLNLEKKVKIFSVIHLIAAYY